MTPEQKQDLAIVVFSTFLGLVSAILLLCLTGCSHSPVNPVSTTSLSGNISSAKSEVLGAQSYVDYSDGKAIVIKNLLK